MLGQRIVKSIFKGHNPSEKAIFNASLLNFLNIVRENLPIQLTSEDNLFLNTSKIFESSTSALHDLQYNLKTIVLANLLKLTNKFGFSKSFITEIHHLDFPKKQKL